jgi:hypothetical protein
MGLNPIQHRSIDVDEAKEQIEALLSPEVIENLYWHESVDIKPEQIFSDDTYSMIEEKLGWFREMSKISNNFHIYIVGLDHIGITNDQKISGFEIAANCINIIQDLKIDGPVQCMLIRSYWYQEKTPSGYYGSTILYCTPAYQS